ncbi:SDR family oxidoreductase [Streptomyces sp. NPDC058272]|uniref:SDR family oxidoreductase n=1 Tax=Streptomyces sp. NPDC058272 TaxID=3346415 RepID=UPI0036EA56DC
MCSATSAARRASSSDWPSNCTENQDEAAFDALFDINVKGTFFTLQKALPLLNEGASVVLTVGAGEVAGAAMTAAKGALLPLMRSLALELAPRHIRINTVSRSDSRSSDYGNRPADFLVPCSSPWFPARSGTGPARCCFRPAVPPSLGRLRRDHGSARADDRTFIVASSCDQIGSY